MELLDYQLDDIRTALRAYVERFAEVEIDHSHEDSFPKIVWKADGSGAHERAALMDLCHLIDHEYFEAVGRGIS